MKAIKHVLTERYYAWEDAVKLAEKDPEVNLSGDGPTFTPREFFEEDQEAAALEEPAVSPMGEGVEQTEPGTGATLDPATIPSSKPQSEAPRI
jgi:large subunit ribosomal protein L47